MSELTNDELKTLRNRLPYRYRELVRNEYVKLSGKTISDRTIASFVEGSTYSSVLHEAFLIVAERKQELFQRTKSLIS